MTDAARWIDEMKCLITVSSLSGWCLFCDELFFIFFFLTFVFNSEVFKRLEPWWLSWKTKFDESFLKIVKLHGVRSYGSRIAGRLVAHFVSSTFYSNSWRNWVLFFLCTACWLHSDNSLLTFTTLLFDRTANLSCTHAKIIFEC